MRALEQPTIDRRVGASQEVDEAAARRSLRLQIAKLERERSTLIAGSFPHIRPEATPPLGFAAAADTGAISVISGPRLLSLEQLERLRDQLAGQLQDVRRQVHERNEHECRARELLERMKLEPARYKFVRLPVRDLGEGGCGVWEVRPRLGLIGMLAGWWQLKLSSGCPLAGGPRLSDAAPPGAPSRDPHARIASAHEPSCALDNSRISIASPNSLTCAAARKSSASATRWRLVIDPIVFVSVIGICTRNLRQRV